MQRSCTECIKFYTHGVRQDWRRPACLCRRSIRRWHHSRLSCHHLLCRTMEPASQCAGCLLLSLNRPMRWRRHRFFLSFVPQRRPAICYADDLGPWGSVDGRSMDLFLQSTDELAAIVWNHTIYRWIVFAAKLIDEKLSQRQKSPLAPAIALLDASCGV